MLGPSARAALKQVAEDGQAGLGRQARPRAHADRRQRQADRRRGAGPRGRPGDRRRVLHRAARRARARPRRLLAHGAGDGVRRRPRGARNCPPTSCRSACCTSATRARSSAFPTARRSRRSRSSSIEWVAIRPWRPARSGTARSPSGWSTCRSRSTRRPSPRASTSTRCTWPTARGSSTARVCPKEDKEVPNDEIVKGYELSDGGVRRADQGRDRGRRRRALEADRRRALRRGRGDRPRLLRQDVLPRRRATTARTPTGCCARRWRESGKVAIARWVFHDRERLVAVRPLDEHPRPARMNFHDEVVRGRRPRPAEPAAQPVRPRDRDGGQARQVARGEVRAGASTRTRTARRCWR